MSQPMPLSEAAIRLRLTYHQVRTLVLAGTLKGGRDAFGRFYADADAVEAFERDRPTPGPVAHAS